MHAEINKNRALPLSCCMTSGRYFALFRPQFPHLLRRRGEAWFSPFSHGDLLFEPCQFCEVLHTRILLWWVAPTMSWWWSFHRTDPKPASLHLGCFCRRLTVVSRRPGKPQSVACMATCALGSSHPTFSLNSFSWDSVVLNPLNGQQWTFRQGFPYSKWDDSRW